MRPHRPSGKWTFAAAGFQFPAREIGIGGEETPDAGTATGTTQSEHVRSIRISLPGIPAGKELRHPISRTDSGLRGRLLDTAGLYGMGRPKKMSFATLSSILLPTLHQNHGIFSRKFSFSSRIFPLHNRGSGRKDTDRFPDLRFFVTSTGSIHSFMKE